MPQPPHLAKISMVCCATWLLPTNLLVRSRNSAAPTSGSRMQKKTSAIRIQGAARRSWLKIHSGSATPCQTSHTTQDNHPPSLSC